MPKANFEFIKVQQVRLLKLMDRSDEWAYLDRKIRGQFLEQWT